MLHWFPAAKAGQCSKCNRFYKVDDQIAKQGDEFVGKDCCSGTGYKEFNKVMPHAKEASDRCSDCFLIHASSQTECE